MENILEQAIRNNDIEYIKQSIDDGTHIDNIMRLVMEYDALQIMIDLYSDDYIDFSKMFDPDLFNIIIKNNSFAILSYLKENKELIGDNCDEDCVTILDTDYDVYFRDAINKNNTYIIDILCDIFFTEEVCTESSEEVISLIEYAIDVGKPKSGRFLYNYLMESCEDENPFQMGDKEYIYNIQQKLEINADEMKEHYDKYGSDYNDYDDDENSSSDY